MLELGDPVAAAITYAISTGSLPRAQAEASARRILALKVCSGLLFGAANPLHRYVHTTLRLGSSGAAVVD